MGGSGFPPQRPATERGLDQPPLLSCVCQGGNLVLAADPEMSDLVRDIGGEFGIDFDKKKSRVIDHFSYEPSLDKT